MPRPLSEYQDEIADGLLEDLAEITGIPVEELREEYEVHPIYEEPEESEAIEMDSDAGDSADYFDDLFDDLDIDPADEEDSYGDEGV